MFVFFFANSLSFNLRQINEQNAKTNNFYGGLYPNATRVLAVQGTGDPWREVGYTKDYVPGVKSLLIQGKYICYHTIAA